MFNTLSKNTICNDDLHRLAEKKGVNIQYHFMPQTGAVAVKLDQQYYIGMDYTIPENSALERIILAHELGHIETDSFYGIRAPECVRKIAESQAERWAVRKLVPKAPFLALLKAGKEPWELAEHFNVTQDYIKKAYHLYFECGMQ